MPSVVVLWGYEGQIAERFVMGMLDLAGLLAMLYLGAGVLDRSQVLTKLGEGFAARYAGKDR